MFIKNNNDLFIEYEKQRKGPSEFRFCVVGKEIEIKARKMIGYKKSTFGWDIVHPMFLRWKELQTKTEKS